MTGIFFSFGSKSKNLEVTGLDGEKYSFCCASYSGNNFFFTHSFLTFFWTTKETSELVLSE